MIYIVGDTHHDIDNIVLKDVYFKNNNIDKDSIDVAIVLGDFGVPWNAYYETESDHKIIKEYSKLPFDILAVPGNHDNYDFINNVALSTQKYNGPLSKVSNNVFYLKRGYVYTINDKTFLCLGGAYSIDKKYRVPGVSWWQEEQWSYAEEQQLKENLEKVQFKVDYVISHTGPSKIIEKLSPVFAKDIENIKKDNNVKICDYIYDNVSFKKFYFGHWHVTGKIEIDNAIQIYQDFDLI